MIFIGINPMKLFVHSLEDKIRKMGAIDKLMPDSAQSEISTRIKDILKIFLIEDWRSESYYQCQNFSDRRCINLLMETCNTVDALSKNCTQNDIWPTFKLILF